MEQIGVTDKFVDTLVVLEREKEVARQVSEMNTHLPALVYSFTKLCEENHGWIQIENKDVFYQTELSVLYPNLETFMLGFCSQSRAYESATFKNKFAGYTGRLPLQEEIRIVFSEKTYPFLQNKYGFKYLRSRYTVFNQTNDRNYSADRNGTQVRRMEYEWYNFVYNSDCYHLPIYPLNKQHTIIGHILQLVEEGLLPKDFSNKKKQIFRTLITFWKKFNNLLVITETDIYFKLEVQKVILNHPELTTLTGKSFDFADIKKEFTKTSPITHPEAAKELVSALTSTYLECDTLRADLEPYNIKILTDPNRGHWDLWDIVEEEKEYTVKLAEPLVARNPEADIRHDGVIGIDFGTKSTVVVYQENTEHTMPLRVGTGQLSKKIEPKHYENPTILEFVDLTSFLTAYGEKEGRPNTLWEQVTTSHTAFENFLASNSNQYYSFLYELKQWAGEGSNKINFRDKANCDFLLKAYQQLGEGDFDPIEIYAYYLGLYINNMHNGIYLNYLLSYPVTYEKEVRDRILASFERGLRKSLPSQILNNAPIMKRFSVALGASEPVAYAICALEEYGFEPDVGEEIFYAVFDFGGGTTDFDFGLFKGLDEDDYDFEVDSFGSSGDQYLGGENLLELLAFEVFKKNQDKLRERSITFQRPPQCKRFAGDEILIADSQEAKLNMAQVKEKLRPLWERHEDYEKDFEIGTIKVNLFDTKGNPLLNEELDVSQEELEQILRDRIELGVVNFFQSLVRAFNLTNNTNSINKMHILLAGNSSKSAILYEVLDKYIMKYTDLIGGHAEEDSEYFLVFPPLGTEESDQFLRSQNMNPKPRNIESPTCKTGVAFGLVKSRQGSRIRLIRETETSEEVKFPYYLGKERRKKFHFVSEPSLRYGEWVKFRQANEANFTFFYTKIPTAVTGQVAISEVGRKLCYLDEVFPEAFVYFRGISPHEVEYVVATEEDMIKEQYLTEPVTVVLEDG